MQRVIPREYGARGFSDIPASELGEVMFELADEVGQQKDKLFQKMVESGFRCKNAAFSRLPRVPKLFPFRQHIHRRKAIEV